MLRGIARTFPQISADQSRSQALPAQRSGEQDSSVAAGSAAQAQGFGRREGFACFATLVGNVGMDPLVHADERSNRLATGHRPQGRGENFPGQRHEGGEDRTFPRIVFNRPLQRAAVEEETERIALFDDDFRVEFEHQSVFLARVEALRDHIVEKVMAPMNRARGIRGKAANRHLGLQGIAGKKADNMRGETDPALVAVIRAV